MDNLTLDLVADLRPVRRRSLTREAAALGCLFTVELALWIATGNVRPDFGQIATTLPVFWWKITTAAALMIIAGASALKSLSPSASPRRGLMSFAAALAVFLTAGLVINARFGFSAAAARLAVPGGLECLRNIIVLSVPPMVAFGMIMRHGGATDREGAALACGLAAAGWGAFVFAFSCPHDDPLFVAVWYPAAAMLSALAAWLVLPRLSRW